MPKISANVLISKKTKSFKNINEDKESKSDKQS